MTTESAPTFRPATEDDRPIIHRLHALTDLWREGQTEHSEGFADDDVRYAGEWSAEHDGGVIVEIDGETAGGAWLRHFTADAPGWGYVADEYPEVAIALEPAFTGRGIGGELMARILTFARDRGAPGVSLSVEVGNERAIRSYRKVGFELIGDGDDGAGGYTMLYRFDR